MTHAVRTPSHWFLRRVADPAIFFLYFGVYFLVFLALTPQFLHTWASPCFDIPPWTFYLLIVFIDAYVPSIWIPSAFYVPRDLALPPPELHLRSDIIPLLVCRHVSLFHHSQRSVYLAVFRSFSPAGSTHVNPGPESRVLQIFLHSPSANLLSHATSSSPGACTHCKKLKVCPIPPWRHPSYTPSPTFPLLHWCGFSRLITDVLRFYNSFEHICCIYRLRFHRLLSTDFTALPHALITPVAHWTYYFCWSCPPWTPIDASF